MIPSSTAATTATLVGIAAATLPSLMSLYSDRLHDHLGVPSSLIPSRSLIARNLLLRVSCSDSLSGARILSATHTLITSMLHHRDVAHWASNMLGLFSVGVSLDAGCVGTLALFFGGGVMGVFAQVVDYTYLRRDAVRKMFSNKNSSGVGGGGGGVAGSGIGIIDDFMPAIDNTLSWILKNATGGDVPSIRHRTYALCGASAGIYSLIGAEFTRLARRMYVCIRRIARTRQRSRQREIELDRLAGLAAVMIGHVFNIGAQVFAFGSSDSEVGHGAHVGGFVFGVAATWMLTAPPS